jgi:hypothetical protein
MVVEEVEVEVAVATLPKEAAAPVVLEVLEVEVLDMTDLNKPETLEELVVYVPDTQTDKVHPEVQVVPEVLLVKLVHKALL